LIYVQIFISQLFNVYERAYDNLFIYLYFVVKPKFPNLKRWCREQRAENHVGLGYINQKARKQELQREMTQSVYIIDNLS
jgi:hypothetical protein